MQAKVHYYRPAMPVSQAFLKRRSGLTRFICDPYEKNAPAYQFLNGIQFSAKPAINGA
jgi:hypothetical protein